MTNEERLALIKKVAEKRNNKLTKAVKKAKHLFPNPISCELTLPPIDTLIFYININYITLLTN